MITFIIFYLIPYPIPVSRPPVVVLWDCEEGVLFDAFSALNYI